MQAPQPRPLAQEVEPAQALALHGVGDDVLEADVESRVGVRGEGEAVLAGDVAGAGVVVAYRVFDLIVTAGR